MSIKKEQFLTVKGRFSSVKITPCPADNSYKPSVKLIYHDVLTFEDELDGVKFENSKEIKYLLQIKGDTNLEVLECKKIIEAKVATEGIRFAVNIKDDRAYVDGQSTLIRDSIIAPVILSASEFIAEFTPKKK